MRNLPRVAVLGLVALGLCFLPVLARSAGAALIVTAARPAAPAVGQAATDGSFLVVWSEDRGTGTGMDLYAARVTASGIVAGTAIPVLVASGNQSDPALVYSELQRAYLLVYTDDGTGAAPLPPTPGVPIPGTPVVTPGLPTPGTTPVVPPPPPLPLLLGPDPVVAPAGAAARLLADPQQPPPTVPPPTAGPPPTGIPPLPTPTGAAPGPTATTDPAAPPAPPTTAGSRDLRGTWLNAAGQRLTVTFPVVTSPGDDTYPSLGYVRGASGDRFALTWREVTGTEAAIRVMRLDGLGFFFMPSARYTVAAGGDLGRPSVAGESNAGDWLVVWSQTSASDPSRDVFSRRLNGNAVPYGTVRVVAGGPSDQAYPSIGSLGAAGGYILAWENREPAQAPDIRVRRLNRNGVPYAFEGELAGGPPFSFAPNIASSPAASTLVVWLDRNAAGDHSVLAAQIGRDGRRLGPERLIVQGGAGPGGATPVIPPPVFPTPPGPVPPVPPAPPPLPTPPLPTP